MSSACSTCPSRPCFSSCDAPDHHGLRLFLLCTVGRLLWCCTKLAMWPTICHMYLKYNLLLPNSRLICIVVFRYAFILNHVYWHITLHMYLPSNCRFLERKKTQNYKVTNDYIRKHPLFYFNNQSTPNAFVNGWFFNYGNCAAVTARSIQKKKRNIMSAWYEDNLCQIWRELGNICGGRTVFIIIQFGRWKNMETSV